MFGSGLIFKSIFLLQGQKRKKIPLLDTSSTRIFLALLILPDPNSIVSIRINIKGNSATPSWLKPEHNQTEQLLKKFNYDLQFKLKRPKPLL